MNLKTEMGVVDKGCDGLGSKELRSSPRITIGTMEWKWAKL